MKSASRTSRQSTVDSRQLRQRLKTFCAVAFLLIPTVAFASADSDRLFEAVTLNDNTYSQLKKLAKVGLLTDEDAAYPLTRYDVARRLLKAREKAGEIVVAQADDMELPPPPGEGEVSDTSSSSSGSDELMAPGESSAAPTQTDAEAIAEALKTLRTLEEAYKWEVDRVKGKLKAVQAKANDVDAQQYDLRKRLRGMDQFPKVAVHGTGRFYALSNQYSGAVSGVAYYPTIRTTMGYLDLGPEGTISKEIGWKGVFRIQSSFTSSDTPTLTVRHIAMDFNPPWMSAQVGDFYETYTPLTLWNRDSLDLGYKPEMFDRMNEQAKYESYFNDEPAWPLRGLRLGTTLMWPEPGVIESFHVSVLAHMIRNGYNDNENGWYYGSDIFTDWIWAGRTSVKTQKAYLGGTSFQLGVDGYGLILDEPLDTELPGSVYNLFNPATWARQYLIGSVKPDLKVGLGGNFFVGGAVEYAVTSFQDDKENSGRVNKDFALVGGPYFQWGTSKLTLSYMDVGPYFYSPLAQTRQDMALPMSAAAYLAGLTGGTPELFSASLRPRTFLANVPRAGAIYGYYDRTQDNVFPYGPGTPNRRGFGGELDVKALEKDSLKVKGSAYFVQEISGNLVVNGGGSGFIPVDTVPNSILLPVRNFTYVNAGPSFNLGPHIGWDRDLEFGTNVRFEQTSSVLGNLSGVWIVGGIRAEILPVWEVSAAYSHRSVNGTESGIGGSLFGRYSYLYDNTDLGLYAPFTVNGSVQSVRISSGLKVNRNSTIFLDLDLTNGNILPLTGFQGTLNNQFAELTYEVQF